MPQITEIEATYRVVTPCFCGGASQRAEFRLPSFKGVLRFWWRALAWDRYAGDLHAIRLGENTIFGSAAGGQSRVHMRLARRPLSSVLPVGRVLTTDGETVIGEGARYLGYGIMHAFASGKTGVRAGELTRECIESPFELTIRLRCRDMSEPQVISLIEAVTAAGLLGGIGARSRRGYGSLSLRSIDVDGERRWSVPGSLNEQGVAIGALRPGPGVTRLPAYTALSSGARHVLLDGGDVAPIALLDLVGAELVRFRSSGRDGKILGGRASAERRFKADHIMLVSGRSGGNHPLRIAFGLPLNFGKPAHLQVRPADHNRRASPLFIHIGECGDRPVAVVSFLPAQFLPGPTPAVSVGGARVLQSSEEDLYRPIHQFLDRLLDPGQRKEPFAEAVEVGR
jgi:CRISPR-associated protein Cmr1